METLFQFLDNAEDFIKASAWRLRRWLTPCPKERRQAPRTHLATPPDQRTKNGEKGNTARNERI